MPKVNIKQHGIALNSLQITIAESLLHSKLMGLESSHREQSQLCPGSKQPSPVKDCNINLIVLDYMKRLQN